jgi:hypothetical protein
MKAARSISDLLSYRMLLFALLLTSGIGVTGAENSAVENGEKLSILVSDELREPILSDREWLALHLDDDCLMSQRPWVYDGHAHFEDVVTVLYAKTDWAATWSREKPRFTLQPYFSDNRQPPFNFNLRSASAIPTPAWDRLYDGIPPRSRFSIRNPNS